ncbi:hypothetical protein PR048_015512 [Dryococelus australis]|uniref:Uncharacterized protein n=1 Tax=Dryococelus australis TaxID=614101 RepID=A0ABQ9HI65_9NEOP|nr:hypothetical protein PR048_015512 [Dryococelus australis]
MKLNETVLELLQAYLHQGQHGQLLQQHQIIEGSSCKVNLNMAAQRIQATVVFPSMRGNDIHERTFISDGSNPSKLTFLQYMQSVSRHLIQQDDIPEIPKSPASTSSNVSSSSGF